MEEVPIGTEKRIFELEKHLKVAGPKVADIVALQLQLEISSGWNKAGYSTNDCAKAMVDFLPKVQQLAKLPNSEQHVFDITFDLFKKAISDLDRKGGSGYGDHEDLYWQMDDALVDATLALSKTKSLKGLPKLIKDIAEENCNREDFYVFGYCERTLPLLKETQTRQTMNLLAGKVLASSMLFNEIITMVANMVILSRGFPCDPLEKLWGTPRLPKRASQLGSDLRWDLDSYTWKHVPT